MSRYKIFVGDILEITSRIENFVKKVDPNFNNTLFFYDSTLLRSQVIGGTIKNGRNI